MTRFKGFKTKKDAQAFIKAEYVVNGEVIKTAGQGMLTTRIKTPTGRNPLTLKDYQLAVFCGGLNEHKYPYCVQWNRKEDL